MIACSAPPEPARGPAPTNQLATVGVLVGAAAVIHALGAWIAQWSLDDRLRTIVAAIADPRRGFLIQQALDSSLLVHVAGLGVPLLIVAVALSLARGVDPADELGLRGGWRAPVDLIGGLALGLGAVLFLMVTPCALVGGRPGLAMLLGLLSSVARQCAGWAQTGWLAVVALVVTCLAYALARLVISHGAVLPLLRRCRGPVAGALGAAAVFAGPYLMTALSSPLAILNLALFGLVLERMRTRSGALWLPLGVLAGWVCGGELSGQPHQGVPVQGVRLAQGLPGYLSGGSAGLEAGLLMTALLAFWLMLVIGSSARPATAPEVDDAAL